MDKDLLLTLDTSTKKSSIGIFYDKKLLISTYIDRKVVKGENLILIIDELLDKASAKKRNINRLAVGIGPGSFTGIRIALSVAKAISYSNGAALKGIVTTDAVAVAFRGFPCIISPMISASSGMFFASLYDLRRGFERLEDPKLCDLKHWFEFLNTDYKDMDICFLFDEHKIFDDEVLSTPSKYRRILLSYLTPSPESMKELFYQHFNDGTLDNPLSLKPLYLRPSAAEERFTNL